MKTLKVSLAALLLTLAVGGAALQYVHAAPQHAKNEVDTWQDTNADGSLKLTSAGGNTYADQAAAVSATGCSGSGDSCAASVTAPDGTETGNFINRN